MTDNIKLLDGNLDFLDGDAPGELIFHRHQDISQEFLDDIRDERNDSANKRMGDMAHVCRIPVEIYDMWMRQGFDMQKEGAARTIARLKAEGLDAFITSSKRF